MSARGYNCPVQILRSTSGARPQELWVVDIGLDAATAPSLATPSAHRPLRIYSLPPSPPYTNPHLRRAIPLPLLDEITSSKNHCFDSMDAEKDGEQRILLGMHGPANLLSPPYSARRRSLSLLTIDEKGEDSVPSSAAVPIGKSDRDRWGDSTDDCDGSEPPRLELKDLDLGEESDDWDEPLFLDAPSALNASDSLSLRLFCPVYSSDDEEPPFRAFVPPPSPTVRSSSLPDFEHKEHVDPGPSEKGNPLFDPSEFDVFENGWDTITTTDSTQSSLLSQESSEDSFLGPSIDPATEFRGSMEPSLFPVPYSPSRRSVIDLPDDDGSDPLLSAPTATRELLVEDEEFVGELDQVIGHSHLSRNTFDISQRHQPFSVPSEVIQTPFSIPLLLPTSATRVPPADSLLFAALEPQDIPLPDSPQGPVATFHGEYVVPPLMAEESRLRKLHQEFLKVEADGRTREVLLTEYIARLNALKPPSPTIPVSVYFPTSQDDTDPTFTRSVKEDLMSPHPKKHQSSEGASISSQYFMPSETTTALEFLQARRMEVQNAISLRAAERRRRKLAKERMRELEALLTFKMTQLCPPSNDADVARSSVTPMRGRRGRKDEAIVLAASGSDRHLAHADGTHVEGACKSQGPALRRQRQDGIMQLVARMVFRRRDTSRPLSGKGSPMIIREYVPSGLSKAAYVCVDEANDDDDIDNPDLS